MIKKDYRCDKCGKTQEVEYPILNPPEIVCTSCDTPMFRLMSKFETLYNCEGFVGKVNKKP